MTTTRLDGRRILVTQADTFNMVEGGYTSGKNIRVVAQVRPAVVTRLTDAPSSLLQTC